MNSIVACQILKLQKDCSVEDLKSAFRKLSRQFHPDKNKNKSSGAKERFVQIKQAYEFLLNIKMNDPNSTESSSTQNQPPPTEFKLDLTLEEILSGCTRKEKIYRRVLDEHGIVDKMEEKILDVPVKRGTLSGTRITIKNEGDIHHDKLPANVVFVVRDKPHELFTRSEFDLKYIVTITSEDAYFGCDLQIPTLNSKVSRPLLLNEKIDEKTEKRIVGHGLPIPDNPEKRGDIIVTFKIINSIQLNDENSQNKEQLPPNERNLVLTLDELFHGCVKSEKIEIKISFKNTKDRKEEKTLLVPVEQGLIHGSKITCHYAGDMCYGKVAADVIFTVIVQQHHIFESNGHDIKYTAKITPKEAILGGELFIPLLENKLFKYAFGGGVFPETDIRIPGMGLPKEENQRGDLIVSFHILFEVDTNITEPVPSQLPPNKFDLNLTLEEIFHGCKKYQKIKIKVADQNGIERIEKKFLKIKIKPGSFEDIIFNREGDRKYGSIPADVIFTIIEEPHKLFKRSGHNLEYSAKITPKEAIMGGIVMIRALDGEIIKLPFEKGVKPGSQFCIPEKGLPNYNLDYKRGDIIGRFEIMFERTPQNPPVVKDLLISLEEILEGCRKTHSIQRKVIIFPGLEKEESKTFTVDIKPGIETNTRFTFPREGGRKFGVIPADVVFVIREKPHEHLKRNGTNLEFKLNLKRNQVNNCGKVEIPTLDGPKQISLNGIVDERSIKIANCGLPYPDNPYKRGYLEVCLNFIKDVQNEPIFKEFEVSLEQILTGCTKKIYITQKTFDLKNREMATEVKCIEIAIKPGTEEKTQFLFEKLGNKTPFAIPANMILVLRYEKHPIFLRVGYDIRCILSVAQIETKNEIEFEIPTLEKQKLSLTGKNIQHYQTHTFPNYGLPFPFELEKRGNLIVTFNIVDDTFKDPVVEKKILLNNLITPNISFDHSLNITRKMFDFDGNEQNETKTITIHILAYQYDDQKFTFPRLGDQSEPHRIPADLVIVAKLVKPIIPGHSRNGRTLHR